MGVYLYRYLTIEYTKKKGDNMNNYNYLNYNRYNNRMKDDFPFSKPSFGLYKS